MAITLQKDLITGNADGQALIDDLESNAVIIENAVNANILSIDGPDNAATGIISGGILGINTDTTKFDISTGTAIVVDNYTDGATPARTDVTLTGTALTVTNIATQERTYITVNSSGTVVQRLLPPTASQRRDEVFLGILAHPDNVNILVAENLSFPIGDSQQAVIDFMDAIGVVNESGNVISANGSNLNINKSAGVMFRHGVNYSSDPQDPNRPIQSAATAGTFRYRYQDGSGGITEGSDVTAIDPDQYDDGDGTLGSVANNRFTIQHASVFSNGAIRIEYGQTIFNSIAEAEAAIGSEVFEADPNLISNASFRCWIIVKKGAADLSDAALAKFIPAGKFGRGTIAGATSSTTTLQVAYDNSIPNPEVLTNAINGSFTLRRGSAADTDDVLEVQNNAGTKNFSVDGNGKITNSMTQAEGNSNRSDLIAIGITASTTQTQGQGALTSEHNFVSTVANPDDTVTLPTAVAGLHVVVFNDGANQLQIFPATSDDLGQGVNTAITVLSGAFVIFRAKDATNWNTVKSGSPLRVSTYTTTGTIDRADMFGAIIRVTGAAVLTLPAREPNMKCTFKTIGSIAVSVKPAAADLLFLDGVALDDGDKATNLSTAGDMLVLTDAGATGFDAATNGWTDTGA